MTSALFSPLSLRGLTLANRVAVSPMCQYSAVEGSATDWHLAHLLQLAVSGAGLVMIEATAVSADGRITPQDLGLYCDRNEEALARVIDACRRFSGAAIGIQLAHSGRKGSARVPWEGGGPLGADAGAWTTLAPSPIPRDATWPAPQEMTLAQIDALTKDFAASARRARRLGVDVVEMHVGHGYLLHEFLSPISNGRGDRYGGSLANRMRLPCEIARAMREEWPQDKPLGARITGCDWLPGGLAVEDAVAFATALKAVGLDYVCVTSGGILPKTQLVFSPGYQVPLAARVKREAGIATQAVGLITAPAQAEEIVKTGQADFVALARAFIDDPRWVWRAARELGASVDYPPQYRTARAEVWPGASTAAYAQRMN